MPFIDARIQVAIAAELGQGDLAWLIEGDAAAPPGAPHARFDPPGPGHAVAATCPCCQMRNPAAIALDALFLARVRNNVPWRRVAALIRTPQGRASLLAALADDPVVSARFRLAP